MIIKTSIFFDKEIPPFILGAFYSRYIFTKDSKYIYTYAAYKSSKFISDDNRYIESKNNYVPILNSQSNHLTNWGRNRDVDVHTPRADFVFILENDMSLTTDSFYNKLNAKILSSKFLYDDVLTENKKKFIRGFFELRGSIDTTRPLLAQDYFFNSKFEVKRARIFTDYFNIPISVMNYNFRELQDQFVSGENKRNTQLRVGLHWYLKNIGLFTPYKIDIVKKVYGYEVLKEVDGITYFVTNWEDSSNKETFESRVQFYSNNIFDRKILKGEITLLRNQVGFKSFEQDSGSNKRNYYIVNLIRFNTEDKCACCCDDYDIKDRSFINKNTGRYYFEIHHVISLGNNYELDDENNLVKLCPICHDSLKRGAGLKKDQLVNIDKILKNSPNALDFAHHFFDEDDYERILELIWERLR